MPNRSHPETGRDPKERKGRMKKAQIRLSELLDAMEMADNTSVTVLDAQTGELHYYDEMENIIDGDSASEEELEAISDSDRYIPLPGQYQIDEYSIMEDYVNALPEGAYQNDLYDAIQGRGAFRRFKDRISDHDDWNRWDRFRLAELEQKGREWAESWEVEIIEDQPSLLGILDEEQEEPVQKVLIVIDMQRDFIDGALGTKEAQAIVPNVIRKIKSYQKEDVWATRDAHGEDYLQTQEGQYLPVPHCIRKTPGWKMPKEIVKLIPQEHIYNKETFASVELAEKMQALSEKGKLEIELVGLCTDICVISNALMLKGFLPEVKILVDPTCCAGSTPEKQQAALEVMRSCQIQVI